MTEHAEHAEHHHALSYADAVRGFRAEKDDYFRTGRGSPVPPGERAAFTGIPYFAPTRSQVSTSRLARLRILFFSLRHT